LPEVETIIQLANLGAIPMLTVAVVVLWRRSEALQREFIDYLKESSKKGDAAAQAALDKRNGHA